ncbi:MAG: isoprenylcysteine carboxylmethyltransferase family protein [Burkholderiales bacterium]|nr:isoprenylcysteine carboxylmethyltransferase family protein [Burkholderiales bacterium]
MRKLKSILFYLLACFVLPLLGKPDLLLHGQVLALMSVAVVLLLSQPALDLAEARERQSTDRHSLLWITVLALPAVVAPLVEWAYFGRGAAGAVPAVVAAGSIEGGKVPPFFEAFSWPPGALWIACGLGLIVGGLALRIWAIGTLGAAFTSTVQVSAGQLLMSTGPFRWVRHPSYLGAYATFLGCAVFLQAWTGLLVAAACMGLAYAIRIPAEERTLSEHFGAEWAAYCRRTRWRMLPGIW